MGPIQRRSFLTSSASLLGGGLIAGGEGHSQSRPENKPTSLWRHAHTVSVMTDTANRLLSVLDPQQKARAVFSFEDEERMRWFYTPGPERKGLALRHMSSYQRHMANALLIAGLSQDGYIKAVTIMSQQQRMTQSTPPTVHDRSDDYFFSIFGTPSDTSTWGYRVEGHHLSHNYTVANGQVVDGPSFFGSLPAEFKDGPRKGLRTMPREEDLGFEMIHALDEPLQQVAIVDPKAYRDILTVNSRTAALKGQPSGLPASKMSAKQFDTLRALAEVYARNLPDDIAQRRIDQIDKSGRNTWFAWAGGTKPGGPHYYRMQTASFLIEFDNLDASGNHIHSVWRDFAGDWGGDLLETHYQESHRLE